MIDIGKILSGKLKSWWGDSIVDNLASDIQAEYFGLKGFSSRNLRRMRLVYECTKILLCKSKSKLTVEYALELISKPMGVATYNYGELRKDIAKYLRMEEDFNRIMDQAEFLGGDIF